MIFSFWARCATTGAQPDFQSFLRHGVPAMSRMRPGRSQIFWHLWIFFGMGCGHMNGALSVVLVKDAGTRRQHVVHGDANRRHTRHAKGYLMHPNLASQLTDVACTIRKQLRYNAGARGHITSEQKHIAATPRPIDQHVARFRPHTCPPSSIVLPFNGLISRQFRVARSDIGKLKELRCSVRLMPRPINRHAMRFHPHAYPLSCIVVPHDDLDLEQFRTNRLNVGKLQELRCSVHLMPMPIDQHTVRFRPHICPPSGLFLPLSSGLYSISGPK